MTIISEDQLGRKLELTGYPRRIVSLVPSQTELLHTLGMEDEVVGITRFCIYPEQWFKEKTRVGGTKDADLKRILALEPDLILANKEENTPELIEALSAHCPVWVSDVNSLEDALAMIAEVGRICNREEQALVLNEAIRKEFDSLPPSTHKPSAIYLIWQDPVMAVGKQTFIDDMLHRAGMQNLVRSSRYPVLAEEELIMLKPEYLLLSTEPYPFKEKHVAHWQGLLPDTSVVLVDGEPFSWYGSRLLKSPSYFRSVFPFSHLDR